MVNGLTERQVQDAGASWFRDRISVQLCRRCGHQDELVQRFDSDRRVTSELRSRVRFGRKSALSFGQKNTDNSSPFGA